MKKARKIDDVTWRFQGVSTQTYSSGEMALKQEELEVISEIVKKPDVIWREVVVFSSLEHLEREKSLILDPKNHGYNLGFYEANSETAPPLVGFLIIDDTELFIAYPHKSIRLTIQHPKILLLFSAYFEDIWQRSEKLKQGHRIEQQKLEHLERVIREKFS